MYCINCGTKLDDDSIFCHECGYRQQPADTKASAIYGNAVTEPQQTQPAGYDVPDMEISEQYAVDRPVPFFKTKKGKIIILAGILIIALVIAAVIIWPGMLNGCGGNEIDNNYLTASASDGSIAYTDTDTHSSQSTLDVPLSENGSKERYSVKWLLQPTVDADRIDVLRCKSAIGSEYDCNSLGDHKYDRISVLEHDGKFGMIINSGGQVTGVEFLNVEVVNGGRYLLTAQRGSIVYYTLSSLYELEKLDDSEVMALRPKDEYYRYVWTDGNGLCLEKGGSLLNCDGSEYGYSHAMAVPYRNADVGSSGYVLVKDGNRLNYTVYEDAGNFSDGVVPVKKNGKWGYINDDGQLVLPFEFDACWRTGIGYRPYNSSDGYITVCKNDRYAIYDVYGNLIINYGMFECICPVYEGSCWVKSDGYWGVIALEDDATVDNVVKDDTSIVRTATVKSSAGLRMREGPGTEYCVVNMLSNHKEVSVYGYGGEWVYISRNGVYGWVKSEFLEY